MKHFLLIFAVVFAGFLMARGPGDAPKMPFKDPGPRRHPMIQALESPEFTPEERAELKKLSQENPEEFMRVMRTRFMERRKKEALRTLELRKNVLEATTPEEKEAAMKLLRADMKLDMMRRLQMHKQILDGTEKSIAEMQARLEKMRAVYEKQVKEQDALVEKRMQELLTKEPSKRLIRDSEWTPESDEKEMPFDHPDGPPPPPPMD